MRKGFATPFRKWEIRFSASWPSAYTPLCAHFTCQGLWWPCCIAWHGQQHAQLKEDKPLCHRRRPGQPVGKSEILTTISQWNIKGGFEDAVSYAIPGHGLGGYHHQLACQSSGIPNRALVYWVMGSMATPSA